MFTDTSNAISRYFYKQAAGLFILRLVTGAIFLTHGWMKVSSIGGTTAMFAHMGLAPSLEWAWFIGLLEVVGGIALILGTATRFFGAVLAIEMLVAIFLTGVGRGWGPHQFEALLAAASLAIALAGSGRWSLYPLECLECGGFLCDGSTCVINSD